MISSGVMRSRCALVSAAAHAIRPRSAEPTKATPPATLAALRNDRRPTSPGLLMWVPLTECCRIASVSGAYISGRRPLLGDHSPISCICAYPGFQGDPEEDAHADAQGGEARRVAQGAEEAPGEGERVHPHARPAEP